MLRSRPIHVQTCCPADLLAVLPQSAKVLVEHGADALQTWRPGKLTSDSSLVRTLRDVSQLPYSDNAFTELPDVIEFSAMALAVLTMQLPMAKWLQSQGAHPLHRSGLIKQVFKCVSSSCCGYLHSASASEHCW